MFIRGIALNCWAGANWLSVITHTMRLSSLNRATGVLSRGQLTLALSRSWVNKQHNVNDLDNLAVYRRDSTELLNRGQLSQCYCSHYEAKFLEFAILVDTKWARATWLSSSLCISGALAWLRVGWPWLIFLRQGFGRFALTFAGNKSISTFHVIWINCYQINSHNCSKDGKNIVSPFMRFPANRAQPWQCAS